MSSLLEDELRQQLKLGGLLAEAQIEYRFDKTRRYRFDFAWPSLMIAAEVEGGTWAGGRHSRGAGFESDAEKYNRATQQGWKVYRFTSNMIRDGRAFALLQDVITAGTLGLAPLPINQVG